MKLVEADILICPNCKNELPFMLIGDGRRKCPHCNIFVIPSRGYYKNEKVEEITQEMESILYRWIGRWQGKNVVDLNKLKEWRDKLRE